MRMAACICVGDTVVRIRTVMTICQGSCKVCPPFCRPFSTHFRHLNDEQLLHSDILTSYNQFLSIHFFLQEVNRNSVLGKL